ncbi:MAG: FtsK/SpoIIIE domain-containing protein, partial [Aquihabitans sp.]
FLFVDYKGGAAFSECVRLPHCVGMVTDLSPHLVRRALESLNAELRHREHILNRKKAKDVLELERLHDPDTPPSLVIIVDEFAALVSEVPEFVDGVVNVAQRGRSLGLHLILATQRPAGVIKDNLRANTNLRVALRMADEADSTDVIGTKGAAAFDPGVPGRGIAKLGPGRLSPFQAAYVGGWTTDQPPPAQVTVSAHEIGAVIEWPEPEEQEHVEETTDPGPNDLSRLVSTISAAALQARVPEPRKPWLPELGATYDLARSPKDDDDLRLLSRTDERLIFAVLDDPASQAQEPVSFDPDRDGNMMVLGTGGSGKSAFLRTLTVAAALSTRGGPCHVYGLDFASRGLDMLEPLPNVGSIISGDDEERVARLLRTLRETVDARLERYAAVRADSITRYREITGDMSEARILLLVDGFATFRQEYEGSGRLQTYDLFQSIATDGRQTGVHVVVAADRAGAIPSALGSVIQQRLVLRMASENEYAVVGVPSDAFPTGTPPGRGFFQEREVQVAVLGGTPNTARQAAAIEHLAEAARDRGVAVAPEVGRLPDAVSLDDLPVEAPGGGIAVGVADTDLAPFGLDLDGPMLIVGPPRSGKTTALVSIVQALQRRHDGLVTVYVGSGRSPAAKVLNWTHQVLAGANVTEHADPAKAALESAKPGQAVLVIDDAPKVSDWMDVDAVSALVEAATEHDHPILAEGETAAMSSSWGLLQALKAQRCGIALVPDQFDGDGVFKTPFPKLARKDFPPGRGLYVRNGQVEKVQLALPLGVHT